MKISLIFAFFILCLTGYARDNSQTYVFGDLQNVISSVEISSLKYEVSTNNDSQPTLKVFLCAVDNPPQIPNQETVNIRKGKSYLVITADNNDNSVIPLPEAGETIYFDGIGSADVDWIYVYKDTRYIYVLLNSGVFESKFNLLFFSGKFNFITNLHYEFQGRIYDFVRMPTNNNEETRKKEYLEYMNKVALFYLTSD